MIMINKTHKTTPGNSKVPEALPVVDQAKLMHTEVVNALHRANAHTMELCYRLFVLLELALDQGSSSFWSEHFQVENFKEYCELKLGITANLGSQYAHAARAIERLKPGYLESVFDGSGDTLNLAELGHTRFREVHQFVPHILRLRGTPDFDEIVDRVLDVSETVKGLRNYLDKRFEGIDVKAAGSSRRSHDPGKRILAIRKRLDRLADDLREILPPEDHFEIAHLVEEITRRLDDSEDPEGETVESEPLMVVERDEAWLPEGPLAIS